MDATGQKVRFGTGIGQVKQPRSSRSRGSTWLFNHDSKSTIAPGMPRNHTVVYSAEGDIKSVVLQLQAMDVASSHGGSLHAAAFR